MKNILSLDEYLVKITNESEELFEGGGYGHLNHPYDDMFLTFGDIRELIDITVNGLFTKDNFVQEKTDGQNLMVTWKNEQLLASRNGGHTKDFGKEALSTEKLAKFMEGKNEDVRDAFVDAMKDLETALSFVDPKKLENMFQEGKRFMSLEVITPKTENTIPYGLDMLVFHGWKEYNAEGDEVGEDKQSGIDIAQMIEDVNQQQQKRYFIRGPHAIEIKPFKDADKKKKDYNDRLDNIIALSPDVNDDTTIAEFMQIYGKILLFEKFPDLKNIPSVNIELLIDRLNKVKDAKSKYKHTELKKALDGEKEILDELVELETSGSFRKEVLGGLMDLFLNLGHDMMRNMNKFLAAYPVEAAEKMRQNVKRSIEDVKKYGDEKDLADLKTQLERITDPKAFEEIVPSEGITFIYKGKLYKFTGMFAFLNQINGILKYKKSKKV